MAKLYSGNLNLEINFTGFTAGEIDYEISFFWKEKPIVDDSILKREGSYWAKRKKGSFLASESDHDTLIYIFEKAMKENKSYTWEPSEPDVIIAIYPEKEFADLNIFPQNINIAEFHKQCDSERILEKQEKGDLPDDTFALIIFVDAYNFKNSQSYYGSGISLHMVVNRSDLEFFISTLNNEYTSLKKKHGLK
ncbi:MAG: hypothetical protein GY756_01615 [bacterium]|nr:hypothetical protein [bacterium]